MKKYYFISYSVIRHTKQGPTTDFFNETIDQHPFEWQLEYQKYMNPKPAWEGAFVPDAEQYTLLFFSEISRAEYEKGQEIEW